jgi:hypothetical protein
LSHRLPAIKTGSLFYKKKLLQMALGKRHLYLKIIEIQDIVLAGQKKGFSQKQIYYNQIETRYFISIRTFYKYLAVNAKSKLKKLNDGGDARI